MKTKESQKKTVYCIYPSEESKGNYKKIQNVVTKKMKILVCSLIIILSNLNFGLKRKKKHQMLPKIRNELYRKCDWKSGEKYIDI